MTLKTSRNTLYLANTKIVDLEHLKNTQPISTTHTNIIVQQFTQITLVTDEYLKSIQENPIQHFDQSLNSLAISKYFEKLLDENFVSRFLIYQKLFFRIYLRI